jgi:hypothetical protein
MINKTKINRLLYNEPGNYLSQFLYFINKKIYI